MKSPLTYHLEAFDGPLDLLLHLISKNKVSIYDIPIAQILEQYMDELRRMEAMDLEVTSDFVAMAAQLMYIKSKMLLPRINAVSGEPETEDPRTELVEKLLEYKRFKAASAMLAEQEERMQRIYVKPQEDISRYTENPDEYLKMELSEFVKAFNLFLYRKKKVEDVVKREGVENVYFK